MVLGRSLGTATLIHTNSTYSSNRIYTKQKSHYLLERTKPILPRKVTGMRLPVPSIPVCRLGNRGNTAGTTCLLAPAAACKVPTAVLEH